MSYIYIAESGDGYVKIGASKYPEDRIKQIESLTGVSITRWERAKKAAEKSPQRNVTHYVSETVMKAVKRSEK